MKQFLIIFFGVIIQSYGQADLKSRILSLTKELEPTLMLASKEDFEGGDVWGAILDYYSSDSTFFKRVIQHEAGEYGQGIDTYYVNDRKLVLVKTFKIDWEPNEDPKDLPYVMTEVNYYFDSGGGGIKESRQARLSRNEIAVGIKELQKMKYATHTIAHDEYVKIKKEANLNID